MLLQFTASRGYWLMNQPYHWACMKQRNAAMIWVKYVHTSLRTTKHAIKTTPSIYSGFNFDSHCYLQSATLSALCYTFCWFTFQPAALSNHFINHNSNTLSKFQNTFSSQTKCTYFCLCKVRGCAVPVTSEQRLQLDDEEIWFESTVLSTATHVGLGECPRRPLPTHCYVISSIRTTKYNQFHKETALLNLKTKSQINQSLSYWNGYTIR